MLTPAEHDSDQPSEDQPALPWRGFRHVLILGFAGMFVLLAAVGFHSIAALGSIGKAFAESDRLFLDKNRALESIRSAFYTYGAEFRQFLVDPDRAGAGDRLAAMKTLRAGIESGLQAYAGGLSDEELPPLDDLRRNLKLYFDFTAPVFSWTAHDRQTRAAALLAREPFEQRLRIVEITDKVGAINERRFRAASQQSEQLLDSIRQQMILMLASAAALSLILAISLIAYDFRLERILRGHYRNLLSVQAELHRLSAKLVNAQEEERRSIARELHDEAGQSIGALLVDLENAAAVAPAENVELRLRLKSSRKLAEDGLNAIRNISLLLRPSMLDDLGLVPALNWQAREVSRRTGTRVEVSAEDLPDELSDEHRTCIFRVVQEALNNAARHAQATAVRVVLRQEPDRLLLAVQDNGRGFDPASTRGLGLLGMEERVRHIGGAFQVESEPGRGALVRVQLPLTDLRGPMRGTA